MCFRYQSISSESSYVSFRKNREVMPLLSIQCFPGGQPELCVGADPAVAATLWDASDASGTSTTTIVFGIIATVLTLFSIVVAIKQYMGTRADAGRDDNDIEMGPQHSALGQGAPAAPPS
jgi:hypothetical protein